MTFAYRGSIDLKTGKRSMQYFADGQLCARIELTSPIARRFAAYSLIRADLLEARDWLNSAHALFPRDDVLGTKEGGPPAERFFQSPDSEKFKLVRALWFASIVIYAKCFANTEGRGVKLERKNISGSLLDCHDEVIALRNTIVAHAGKTHLEGSTADLVLHPDPEKRRYWLHAHLNRTDFSDDRGDPVNFKQLLEAAVAHVDRKLEDLKVTIRDRELVIHPIEHWYAEASKLPIG